MSESKSKFTSKSDVETALGAETCDLLSVFEKDGCVCLKPKSYLGTETFKDLAARIRELGGDYANGLFKIPLKTDVVKEVKATYVEVRQMVMDLRNYVEQATEGILKKIGDLQK